MKLELDHKNN